jgi:hypothetical protein
MARFLKHTFILPSYWASALVNGDYTGLYDDDEVAEVESCADWLHSQLGNAECVDISEEEWFATSNDWDSTAGNVLEYTFLTNVEDYFVDDIVNHSSLEDHTVFTVYLRTPRGDPLRVTKSSVPGCDRTAAECLEYWLSYQEEA